MSEGGRPRVGRETPHVDKYRAIDPLESRGGRCMLKTGIGRLLDVEPAGAIVQCGRHQVVTRVLRPSRAADEAAGAIRQPRWQTRRSRVSV
jgi:hypothetical protein